MKTSSKLSLNVWSEVYCVVHTIKDFMMSPLPKHYKFKKSLNGRVSINQTFKLSLKVQIRREFTFMDAVN